MKRRGQQVYELSERIARMVVVNPITGCHEWQGATRGGYGRMITGSRTDGTRKTDDAHRVSFRLNNGEIPIGFEICHRCDNRPCVNPEHLFLGTRQDNVDDREQKGRNRPCRGSKVGTAKLTESLVQLIRAMVQGGATYSAISRKFKVDRSTIRRAANGEQWRHVLPAAPLPQDKP